MPSRAPLIERQDVEYRVSLQKADAAPPDQRRRHPARRGRSPDVYDSMLRQCITNMSGYAFRKGQASLSS